MSSRKSDRKLAESGKKKVKEAEAKLPADIWGAISVTADIADRTLTNIQNGLPVLHKKMEAFIKLYNDVCQEHQMSALVLNGIDVVPSHEETFDQMSEENGYRHCISILQASMEEGIISIYRRGNRIHDRIREAVSQADVFIYTLARTHRSFLIQDGGTLGWGIETLAETIRHKPDLTVRMLLADSFDLNSGYRHELSTYFNRSTARSHCHAGRDTVRGTISMIDSIPKHDFRLRLLPLTPPYCMLLTENIIFWEPYFPSATGGEGIIIEAKPIGNFDDGSNHSKNMYNSILQDFIKQYCKATPVSEAERKFLERKESTLAEDDRERDEKIIKMVDKWEKKSETDPRIKKIAREIGVSL